MRTGKFIGIAMSKRLSKKQRLNIAKRLADHDASFKPSALVFLDIDGVLNRSGQNHSHDAIHIDIGVLHKPQIEHLNSLIKQSSACICLISSWRDQDGLWDVHQLLRNAGITGSFVSDAPYLQHGSAYDEIMLFLERKSWKTIPYAVLDDCNRYPEHFQEKLIHTDRNLGLTAQDTERALGILRSICSF